MQDSFRVRADISNKSLKKLIYESRENHQKNHQNLNNHYNNNKEESIHNGFTLDDKQIKELINQFKSV